MKPSRRGFFATLAALPAVVSGRKAKAASSRRQEIKVGDFLYLSTRKPIEVFEWAESPGDTMTVIRQCWCCDVDGAAYLVDASTSRVVRVGDGRNGCPWTLRPIKAGLPQLAIGWS